VNRESDIDSQRKINKLLATVWAWSILKFKKKYDSERKFSKEWGFNAKGDRNSSLPYSVDILSWIPPRNLLTNDKLWLLPRL